MRFVQILIISRALRREKLLGFEQNASDYKAELLGSLATLQFLYVFLYCIIFWLNENELN